MAISKEKKHTIVATFNEALDSAQSVAFVNFHKVTVLQANALRRALRAQGVGYIVGKKTLLKRAMAEKGLTGELPPLEGEIAIAYSADLLAPAREVYNFQKANKNSVTLVGGIFEGKYQSQTEMVAIATIPPIETLRGMFLNVINSPIQRFAIALSEVAKTKN